MDGSLVCLAGQVVSEYELWDPSSLGRPLEEVLTVLRKGALLLKHGRQGKPKVHFFRLTASDTVLKWRSASGSVRQVKLRTVTEVVAGQTTEVFKRYMLRETGLSFSLKYTDDDGSHRTLDLTCSDLPQYSAWYIGLKVVADRLRVTGTPALPAAAAFAASTPLGGSGGSSFSSLLLGVGNGAAEAQRRYGGGTAVGRASGAMGIPVVEHVPGDLLMWGAASRAPIAPSTRSAPDPDLWQRSKVPLALPCNASLDVRCAAVGRLHGILLTSSGSVYTWGEGRGGKLGLGHDQDQALPQRLEQGLRGQCVVAVASGDDCTAAVTEDGTLYMWGRLAGSPRPQLVPVPVRGDLQSRVVTKVSCGPFHCAAVSLDGALFTWGEGFGGKLGHGNQNCQEQPTLVEALVGRQVLNVACGVWHTAAVVVENEGPLGQALMGASPQAPSRPTEQQQQQGVLQDGAPPRLESSALSMSHHRRNSSASSAFSEASLFHEGQGGCLYTWGGVNESLYGSEKRDSNKGCLGHGDADIYAGQLLPTRVSGALEGKVVRHVAAGLHLTVAVTTGGRVFQMGCTGATAGKHCPWEGATSPELVKGAVAGYFVDSICCGTHHVLALARPLDRRQARPVEHGATTVFAWGKGSEGQLGSGKFDDSATPLLVDALKGRSVLQVSCGGSNALAVCEHDLKRFEPDSREAADQAMAALYGLMDQKPPKQLRITIPEGYSSGALTTSRARSMVQQSGNSMALVPHSSAGSLSRPSAGQRPLGAGGRPPTISEMYATLRSAQRQQHAAQRGGIPPRRPGGSGRTDPGGTGREPGGSGSSLGSTAAPRVLGVPSGSLRRGSGLGMGVSASMPSLSGISHAPSWGAASELSSISSLRQASEDWGAASSVGGDSQHYYGALGNGLVSASGAFHSGGMDLAAIDESGSAASLSEELNEKNRIIERLESKLHQLRRQVSKVSSHDSEERLWHSVRASAGQFRESFMAAADVGGSVSGRSGRFTALSRPSMTVSDAGTAATGDEEREASLQAMEQMLVRKQVHLESQQHKLIQWAAELQRREMELQRQAQAEGRPFTAPSAAFQSATSAPATLAPLGSPDRLGDGVPAPIPSESPIFPRLRRSQAAATMAAAANGSSRADLSSAAAGAAPDSVPGVEHPGSSQGVGPGSSGDQPPKTPLTHSRAEAYGLGTPQHEPSTGLSNGDASEWMEEIEPGVFVTYTIEESGLRKLKRIRFSRTVFSKDSAAKWYEANKHRLAQPIRAPRPTTHHHFSTPVPLPSSAPPLLHSQATLGSRNLSFDPSELAALHMQAQQQQHGSKPPSRLSQASRQGEAGFAADHQALEAGIGGLPTVPSEGEVSAAEAPGIGEAESRNGSANGIRQPQQDSAPPSPFADRPRSAPVAPGHQPDNTDENGQIDGGDAEAHPADAQVAAGTVPASPQQQQQLLLADLMSLSRTSTTSAMFGASEGASAPGSGRSSPSKRSTQQHAFAGPAQYRQGALQARPQGLSRELSTASVSSMRSEASRASKASGQFSPRFAAAAGPMDPRSSPQPAAALAHAASGGRLAGSSSSASSIAAAMAVGGSLQRLDRQASSTPSSPFAAAAAAGGPFDDGAAGSGGASSTPSRTPQGSMLSAASLRAGMPNSAPAAADLSPSPSRFTRLKAAFSSSSKKKDKGDRAPSC